MDISNLAVVIGPNILHRRKRGGSDSKSQLANEAWEAPIVIEVVKELIEQHRLLFTVSAYFLLLRCIGLDGQSEFQYSCV